MTIQQTVQKAAPGKRVSLFQLDLTPLGGAVQYFTPSVQSGGTVAFDGHTYVAAPVTAEGFEVSSTGEQARPVLRIGNVRQGGLPAAATSLVIDFQDLVGAIVRRIRTFAQYLDGAAEADPTAILDLQVYRIVRKARQNRVFIEWDLASPLDHDAAMIPRRPIMPDYCTARYRRWDPATAAFVVDTTDLVCPYAGSNYFDINDQPVADPALDRASKTLGCCRARFGVNAALPFMNEPAIGRVR
mgnify:CR=1 FL=1